MKTKNNTLYIGPYRQRDLVGLWSQSILLNIYDNPNVNIFSRPIYLDTKYGAGAVSDIVQSIENKRIDKHDTYQTVIHHVPLDYATPIDNIDNNIIIPILDDQELSDIHYQTLLRYKKIYVDNKQDYIKLIQFGNSKLNKTTVSINYEKYLSVRNKATFDMGVLRCTKKIYTITNYSQNIRTINQIIRAYIQNIKYAITNNLSLILFVLDIEPSEKVILDRFITECYEASGSQYAINRVVIAPITSDINNIYIAHNTGDIYVSLTDYGSDTLNTKIAQGLKKDIISFEHQYYLSFTNRLNQLTNSLSIARPDDVISNAMRNFMNNGVILSDNTKQKTQPIHTLSIV